MKLSSSPGLSSLFFTTTLATASVRTIYQFPNPTWLENIAAMRNGSLLTSTIGAAEVHLITPLPGNSSTATLAASWPDRQAVLGISELRTNVFAVAVGNTTASNTPVPNTFGIWTIDVCGDQPVVSKLTDLPGIQGVNGMAVLPHSNKILIADSWAGDLVALDTATKKTSVILQDGTTATNTSATIPIGINGLKVRGDYVYYSNLAEGLLARVKISREGEIVGSPSILAAQPDLSSPDDLAIAKDGSVYQAEPLAASQGGDEVLHVGLDGSVSVVAEGGAVAGSTGVTMGRTKADKNMVYVSTMGGFGADGKPIAGGRVVAIDLGY